MNEYIDKIKQAKEEILKERLNFQKEKESWENFKKNIKMSVSSKNILKISQSLKDNELLFSRTPKRENSLEKSKKHINLKSSFYKKESSKDININKGLSILNFIQNKSNERQSVNTAISAMVPEKFDYDLDMVNKYHESDSLSFISEFDLEEDDTKQNDSFSSCENDDNSIEEIQIVSKSHKRISCDYIYQKKDEDEDEFDLDLEKDWNEIKDMILNKKETQICI